MVNKHYSLKRKHFTLNEGPVQQVQQHKTLHTHTQARAAVRHRAPQLPEDSHDRQEDEPRDTGGLRSCASADARPKRKDDETPLYLCVLRMTPIC